MRSHSQTRGWLDSLTFGRAFVVVSMAVRHFSQLPSTISSGRWEVGIGPKTAATFCGFESADRALISQQLAELWWLAEVV